MKKRFTLLIAVVLMLSFLPSCKNSAKSQEVARTNFYYKDTKWGMPLDDVIKLNGEPDMRSDEIDIEAEESADEVEIKETNLLDIFYANRTLYDKYSVTEKYQFDADNQLEGVIAEIYTGEIAEDLTNMDELVTAARSSYSDIKSILTAQYGEPAAEYTAYRDGNEYKTENVLDFDKEDAVAHATRWDGENYRFIYILYYPNDIALEVNYIPHDKETIDRVNSENNNQ